MNTLVMKFGGTSVMDTNKIKSAAEIVMSESSKGNRVVVVVSAMGHTTDHLIGMAETLQSNPDSRELDVLMITGEQISSALMAMAIQALGGKAKSFSGSDAGIVTDSQFGSAQIKKIDSQALTKCLEEGCIPVVAGFQGKDAYGQWTTLGRGGSDTTAIAIAGALNAEWCDIYSDVNGIYSADPNSFSHAYKLDAISYIEMLELARNGAQVLNARSVEIAMKNHVPVRVRSTFQPSNLGTVVTERAKQVNWFTGLAVAKKQACIKIEMVSPSLDSIDDPEAQRQFRHERFKAKVLFQRCLRNAKLDFEIGRSLKNSSHELSICVDESIVQRVIEVLADAFDDACGCLSFKDIKVETELVKVSIVANELSSAEEVDAILSLTKSGISIRMVIAENHRLSFVIPSSLQKQAVEHLHANLCELQLVS